MKIFQCKDIYLSIMWVVLIFLGRLLGASFNENMNIVVLNNVLTIILFGCIPIALSVYCGILCFKKSFGVFAAFIRTLLMTIPGFIALWILFVLSEEHIAQKYPAYAVLGGIFFIGIASVICGGLSVFVYGLANSLNLNNKS